MAYKQLKLWFDGELAKLLAEKICQFYPQFDKLEFTNKIKQEVEKLELKDRVELIADQFHDSFDHNYLQGIKILAQILGPENVEETGMFSNFYWIMPIAKYVEKYGLDNFEVSINAIAEITKRNTGEYAIRPYLQEFPDRTLSVMLKWSKDNNFHVRRLASEGGRPRLPWARKMPQFIDDPRPLIPILNNLKDDPSRYVQKSVANCLHDILKDNRQIGEEIIHHWLVRFTTQRKWIIRHSLRTLLKSKDRWAVNIVEEAFG